MNSIYFSAAIALALSGCATSPVVNYKNILISPPDSLIRDCQIEAPPQKELYLNASQDGREDLLFDLSSQQIKNIFVCNSRLAELREWKKKQKKLYSAEQVNE